MIAMREAVFLAENSSASYDVQQSLRLYTLIDHKIKKIVWKSYNRKENERELSCYHMFGYKITIPRILRVPKHSSEFST